MSELQGGLIGGGEVSDFQAFAGLDTADGITEESLLNTVDEVLKQYELMMGGVRSTLAQVLGDRKILVVDAAMGYPSQNMRDRLDLVEAKGFAKVRDLVEERLFDGSAPRDFTDFLRSYYGREINFVNWDVRAGEEIPDLSEYAAVVFSGSPANLSLKDDDRLVADTNLFFSHRDIFEVVSAVQGKAVEAGLPVIGVCYGAHVLAHQHGGVVRPMDEARMGMRLVRSSQAMNDFASDVMGIDIKWGESYVAHGEGIVSLGASSRSLSHSDSSDTPVRVNHLSLHIDERDGRFEASDISRDADLLRRLMAEGKYAAFGVQGHHELAFPHLLLGYINSGKSLGDFAEIVRRCRFTRDSLQLVMTFLNLHRISIKMRTCLTVVVVKKERNLTI